MLDEAPATPQGRYGHTLVLVPLRVGADRRATAREEAGGRGTLDHHAHGRHSQNLRAPPRFVDVCRHFFVGQPIPIQPNIGVPVRATIGPRRARSPLARGKGCTSRLIVAVRHNEKVIKVGHVQGLVPPPPQVRRGRRVWLINWEEYPGEIPLRCPCSF